MRDSLCAKSKLHTTNSWAVCERERELEIIREKSEKDKRQQEIDNVCTKS